MLSITKMLTLSTAHLSDDMAAALDEEAETPGRQEYDFGRIAVYEKDGYGWFLYLPEQSCCTDCLPEELAPCVAFAQDLGCTILCFDCEGPVVPYLPVRRPQPSR